MLLSIIAAVHASWFSGKGMDKANVNSNVYLRAYPPPLRDADKKLQFVYIM